MVIRVIKYVIRTYYLRHIPLQVDDLQKLLGLPYCSTLSAREDSTSSRLLIIQNKIARYSRLSDYKHLVEQREDTTVCYYFQLVTKRRTTRN